MKSKNYTVLCVLERTHGKHYFVLFFYAEAKVTVKRFNLGKKYFFRTFYVTTVKIQKEKIQKVILLDLCQIK